MGSEQEEFSEEVAAVMREEMNFRETYDILIAQYGQVGIDSILCPCWDIFLITYDPDGRPGFPYRDFIDNLEWFLDVLRERGKWPLSGSASTTG